MDALTNRPVLVSSSAGAWVGLLESQYGKLVTLTRCRQLIGWRDGEVWADIAGPGITVREAQVSDRLDGPVLLTDVQAVMPLSKRACQRIVQASEDNLPIELPAE